MRKDVLDMALERPELSPRELAVGFTDERSYFVSEASVYRLLKAHGLITSLAHVVLKAADEFRDKTTATNQMWQTDFTYFKITGWGWYYLSSILDDYTLDSNGYVTMTDASNVTFGREHRREKNENAFNQGVLTGKWDVSENLSIDGHVGAEKSFYKTPYEDKFYMRAESNLIANYCADGRSASFQYPNWDTTDPANYAMDTSTSLLQQLL